MGLFSDDKPVPVTIRKSDHDKVVADLKAEHAKEIKNLKAEHANETKELRNNFEFDTKNLKQTHQIELKNKDNEHALAVKDKDFKMAHHKDEELKAMEDKLNKANERVAVLTSENAMLSKNIEINADILDIKNVVNQIIGKLPTINVTTGSLGTPAGGKAKE